MKRSEVSVVIVGAGVSGLSAASHLIKAGFSKITILEASDRIGGRIRSVRPGDAEGEGIVELGATVIHGASPENPVYKLATEWGMAKSLVNIERISADVYQENGERISKDLVDKLWERYLKLEDSVQNIYLSQTGSSVSNTVTVAEFYEKEKPKIIQEFPEEQREEVSNAFSLMINFCSFMHGDDLSKVSASLGGHYKTFPGEEKVFPCGYKEFAEQLKKEIPAEAFRFNMLVKRVYWGDSGPVKITCNNEDFFAADHVVVTCSLGHLKHNYKELFDPPLPEFKAGAINRTGFGRVNKLFLYYNKPFFQKGIDLAWSDPGSPDAKASGTDWLRGLMGFEVVPTNPKVIGGPFAGQGAEIMEGLSDEEVAEACTVVLRKFLKDPNVPLPDKVLRSRWISDPLFRGSYTYLTQLSHDNDIADIGAPLPNDRQPRLQFAGEATDPEYYSTVHAAYLSGLRESQRLIQLYGD